MNVGDMPAAKQQMLDKRARFFVIDANKVARESKMGGRINTIMQVCFFSLSGVLPPTDAIAAIKNSIRKTYGKKGEEIVEMNLKAVDNTLANLYEVSLTSRVNGTGGYLIFGWGSGAGVLNIYNGTITTQLMLEHWEQA